MSCSRSFSFVIPALAVLAGGAAPSAFGDDPLLRLTATAIDPGGPTAQGSRPASAGTLDIGIERWTTDADHARLAAILAEKGPDELLSELQDLPRAGYIRAAGRLGWEIHYARQIAISNGARRIVIATSRPMNFWELWNRPRSADYQYTLVEVHLSPNGEGQGTLVPAARIDYDEATGEIEVENYASQPVRLTRVRVEN